MPGVLGVLGPSFFVEGDADGDGDGDGAGDGGVLAPAGLLGPGGLLPGVVLGVVLGVLAGDCCAGRVGVAVVACWLEVGCCWPGRSLVFGVPAVFGVLGVPGVLGALGVEGAVVLGELDGFDVPGELPWLEDGVDGCVPGVVVLPGVVFGVVAGPGAEFVLVPGVRPSAALGVLVLGVLVLGVLELGVLVLGVLVPGVADAGVLVAGELCWGTDGRPPGVVEPLSLGVVRGVEAGPEDEGLGDEGGPPADGVDVPGAVDGVPRGALDAEGLGLVAVPPPEGVPPEFVLVRAPASPPVDGAVGEVGMELPPSPRGADVAGSEVVGGGAELVCVGALAARLSTCAPTDPPLFVDGELVEGEGLGADCALGEVMPPGLELPPLGVVPPGLPPLSEALGDGEGLGEGLLFGAGSSKSLRPGLSLREGALYWLGPVFGVLLLPPESELGPGPTFGPEGLSPLLSAETVLPTFGPPLLAVEFEPELEFDEELELEFESDVELEPESFPVLELLPVLESLPVFEFEPGSPFGREELLPSGPLFA
ncbi:hypothetical protein [Streptomyces luteolus]|uniref:Uncharacterized protein n=1 Tax=Streptomyces luteolus TaxID=3043615 RepID=A0ABT6SYS0_9ACTN|nr:hypothetical protein [Streptomyces sp. B-S-A12]MDI3420754.1 hypothetical protein [Streptomyces sp. B-S-A12]